MEELQNLFNLSKDLVGKGQVQMEPPVGLSNPSRLPPPEPESLESPRLSIPSSDFSDEDKSDIELSKLVAAGHERKDRVNQAKFDAQLPYIQKNLEESKSRADEVIKSLEQARLSLQAPPPSLAQGQLNLGEMLATGLGMVLGGRPDQLLGEAMIGADKRNALDYQNQLNAFNLNRDQAQHLVGFLQQQLMGEQRTTQGLEQLGISTQIDRENTLQQQGFQAEQAQAQREYVERDKAWSNFYNANSDGEVIAASNRLKALDPQNAPNEDAVTKALASARTRREQTALQYYNQTVKQVIDAYGGVVPESVKADLDQRNASIASNFSVDPKLFGEIPTEAYWKRQLETRVRDEVVTQWNDRLGWMKDKEKNDHQEALARINIARQQAQIAQQNANTNRMRAHLSDGNKEADKQIKSIEGKLQTQKLDLKALDARIADFQSRIKNAKPSEKRELQGKLTDANSNRVGIVARVDSLTELLNEVKGIKQELLGSGYWDTYTKPSTQTGTTSSGARYEIEK